MFKTNNKKIALFDLDETLVQSDCRNHALKLICEDLSWRTGIWTKELFNKNTKGNIYTLVDSEPHATLEIVYMLKSLADREVKINFKNMTGITILQNSARN